ncbi:MAG: hypothetical protein ACI9U2_001635 [Bradymonadia bacterium]|jgi:hypothetical protein
MLGGGRLDEAPWSALADALSTVVLVDEDPVPVRYQPKVSPQAVQVDWPDEYGGDGPLVGPSLASLLTPHQRGLLVGIRELGLTADWYALGRITLAQAPAASRPTCGG